MRETAEREVAEEKEVTRRQTREDPMVDWLVTAYIGVTQKRSRTVIFRFDQGTSIIWLTCNSCCELPNFRCVPLLGRLCV